MQFIKIIGFENREIEFEHSENCVKEIPIYCVQKPLAKIKIKVKVTDPDVFSVVGKPIVFSEKDQREILQIKAKFARNKDNEKDKILIEAYESNGSLSQSMNNMAPEFHPPLVQDIVLSVRVVDKKPQSKIIYVQSQIKQSEYVQKKSEFLSVYQQKSQIEGTSLIDSGALFKQEYEELLIKTDEQEKELFKLSELKNRLARQKTKQQQIVEPQKQKQFNNISIGYSIIIILLSFMIGMLTKN